MRSEKWTLYEYLIKSVKLKISKTHASGLITVNFFFQSINMTHDCIFS